MYSKILKLREFLYRLLCNFHLIFPAIDLAIRKFSLFHLQNTKNRMNRLTQPVFRAYNENE